MAKKRPFGTKRMLPSGRVQATYVGPDGKRHNAPFTFNNRQQAAAYLETVRAEIILGICCLSCRTFEEAGSQALL
jgi:hypothetical protein